ncbi:uncharacterized protein QC763_502488 [Podospora pseudopauciseta]|uniref:Uncharacterized protein n=1 Tax=Podospora pseudopauciseta TaxID=2093780 RepID=A0ABR0H7E0_9PEZI|nr:hypothetical protein QC763_502488 [Podospora pseudopauciseta]
MPDHAYHRQEGPFKTPNSVNIRQSRRATQVLNQVLQQDQVTAAKCFPWQCPPPSPSKKRKPMSAMDAAILEEFHQKHADHVEPFSRPAQYQSRPAPSHHIRPPLQGLLHSRSSHVSSMTPQAGNGPSTTTSRPVTHVSTAPVHGRPAHHHQAIGSHWTMYDQQVQVAPDPQTERLAASAAKTRIHQILHRDGTRRAANGRGKKVTSVGGSSLKRQMSVNNGDAREELARLAESRTGGNNGTVSRPSKKARKRVGK